MKLLDGSQSGNKVTSKVNTVAEANGAVTQVDATAGEYKTGAVSAATTGTTAGKVNSFL